MKNLSKYLLVTDLDGTLFEDQESIPPENISAINEFVSMGGNFTIATGRGVQSAASVIMQLNTTCAAIINNGQSLYDFINHEFVYDINLPEESKEYAKEFLKKFDSCGIEIYSGEKAYAIRVNDIVQRHFERRDIEYVFTDYQQASTLKWSKLLICDIPERMSQIRSFAKSIKPESIDILDSSETFMETATKGVNKGSALLRLSNILGIEYKNTYSIGNYYNDADLVNAAYCGALVANAPTDMKRENMFLTKSNCESGGFAEFVHYIINKE